VEALLLTVHMGVYLIVVMVAVLLSTILPVTSKKRKYTQRKPKQEDPTAPLCPGCPYGYRRIPARTSLRAGNVRRTRRTAVQGAAHRRRRRRRRMVLPSPLSSKAQPLARLRAPFAGLAVTSSHPDRIMPGVRHGDTRGTARSISQMIRMPRRTWPGGRMPGVAAGSQRSKRAGRRTSRGCTARRTQN
jgi:hypothetical protein